MSGKHSDFGGSIIGRIIACPGSYALTKRLPPGKSSSFADEGSFAHKLAEIALCENSFDASIYDGLVLELDQIESSKKADREMIDAVNIYLRAVQKEIQAGGPGTEYSVEDTFVIDVPSANKDEVFGANDCLVYQPERNRLVVFDYKHGAGVVVDVTDNAQLKFYALGALLSNPDYRVTDVELVVVQPRSQDAPDHPEFGVKRYALETSDLLDFVDVIDLAVRRAKAVEKFWQTRLPETWTTDTVEGAPVLAHGDHCKFCSASAGCPARFNAGLADFKHAFKSLDLDGLKEVVDKKELTLPAIKEKSGDLLACSDFGGLIINPDNPEQLGALQKGTEALIAWAKDAQKFVLARMLEGKKAKGYKLVLKQERRKFIGDEKECAAYMDMCYGVPIDAIAPRQLLGVSDMKLALAAALPGAEAKEAIADFTLRYTEKKSSGVTLALESDKRPAASAESLAGITAIDLSSENQSES